MLCYAVWDLSSHQVLLHRLAQLTSSSGLAWPLFLGPHRLAAHLNVCYISLEQSHLMLCYTVYRSSAHALLRRLGQLTSSSATPSRSSALIQGVA